MSGDHGKIVILLPELDHEHLILWYAVSQSIYQDLWSCSSFAEKSKIIANKEYIFLPIKINYLAFSNEVQF